MICPAFFLNRSTLHGSSFSAMKPRRWCGIPCRSSTAILFVIIGKPSYICIASPLMISPLNLWPGRRQAARLLAWTKSGRELRTCDLPVPVAPRTTSNGSFGGLFTIVAYLRALMAGLSIRAFDFGVGHLGGVVAKICGSVVAE
jgi:hypothetical protein